MKLYTRTGDNGTTGLFAGGRVRKDDLRVEAYGTIDELNSTLGVVRAHQPHDPIEGWLDAVQQQLFHLGADLATPLDTNVTWVVRITPDQVSWLEQTIDHMDETLTPLQHFILPGGTLAAAHLHIARTVCRRAERLIVSLADQETLNDQVIPYVNRLSDWLFSAARYANLLANVDEMRWIVR